MATRLPSIKDTDGITFADDAAGFATALEQAIHADDTQARAGRTRLAEGHSWDARLREIATLIEQREAS